MCLSCHWLQTASSTGIAITSHLPWKFLNWLQGGQHWASLYICVSIDKCGIGISMKVLWGKWRGWSSLVPQQTQKFTEGSCGIWPELINQVVISSWDIFLKNCWILNLDTMQKFSLDYKRPPVGQIPDISNQQSVILEILITTNLENIKQIVFLLIREDTITTCLSISRRPHQLHRNRLQSAILKILSTRSSKISQLISERIWSS